MRSVIVIGVLAMVSCAAGQTSTAPSKPDPERPLVSPRAQRVVDLLLREPQPVAHICWQHRRLAPEAITAGVRQAFSERAVTDDQRRQLVVALDAYRVATTERGAAFLIEQLGDERVADVALNTLLQHAEAGEHDEVVAALRAAFDAGEYTPERLATCLPRLGRLGGAGRPLAPQLESLYLDVSKSRELRGAALGAWIGIVGVEGAAAALAALREPAPYVALAGAVDGLKQVGFGRGEAAPEPFTETVLRGLAATDPAVHTLAGDALEFVFGGWGLYEEVGMELRLKPELEARIKRIADAHGNKAWSERLEALVAELRVDDARQRRYHAVKRQRILTDNDAEVVRLADRDHYPGVTAMHRRRALVNEVRRVVYEIAGERIDDEALNEARRERLDAHAQFWATPLMRVAEPLLGPAGFRWYADSIRMHLGEHPDFASEPVSDAARRWMRSAAARWIGRQMVDPLERRGRHAALQAANEALVEAFRETLRESGVRIMMGGERLAADARAGGLAAWEAALRSPTGKAALLSHSLFWAQVVGGVERVSAWDVAARKVVGDVLEGRELIVAEALAASAPGWTLAVFWATTPEAGGRSEYRAAIDRLRAGLE